MLITEDGGCVSTGGSNVICVAAIIIITPSELCDQKHDRPQFSSLPEVLVEPLPAQHPAW